MFRKLALAGAFAVLAVLAGCATAPNVVNNNTEAGAEGAYITAATLESAYFHLSFCAAGVHFELTTPCKETAIIRQVKANDRTAYSALLALRQFHKANSGDRVALSTYIATALGAIQILHDAIPGA